ncbi:MAG: DUF927 domain-containing protein [Thiothrix sp.]|nr:DUF927 domain-containing protein [Thiothrix sp.]HPQ96166.1 DUF927 domain-containing protein [Thiolinea sp.]
MTISQNHQSVGLGGAVFEFPKSGIHSSDHTDKQGEVVIGQTGTFTLQGDSVVYIGFGKDGQQERGRRICSALRILGETRNGKAREWGRLLEWRDNDDNLHQWAMPMGLVVGDGVEVLRELLRRGLDIAHGKGKLVIEYITSCKPESRITCTDKTGWHADSFVTHEGVYGPDAETLVYQNEEAPDTTTGQAGALHEWKASVSMQAIGNSRLVLALSSAFAGALVHPSGIGSGGFHFHGGSSSGKTTAQLMAASVWGNPDAYKRSWRATSNGLEGVASLHNDGLLILDEIREISGKDASETAYMLGNGQGKTRSNRTGGARVPKSWRLLFLSSGEVTLSEMLKSEGRRVYAGQEVRIADIRADAGKGMGILENLNHHKTPAGMADSLRYETSRQYGTAGAAWIEAITKDARKLWDSIPAQVSGFCDKVANNAGAQAHRVAKRFALVAIAGELATQAGITGWPAGEATRAVERCFYDWLQDFGAGAREERQVLDAVRACIERNTSLFQDCKSTFQPKDMLGMTREPEDNADGKEYAVLASQLDRITEGFSKGQAIAAMKAAGWLHDGRSASVRIPGLGNKKCYVISIQD